MNKSLSDRFAQSIKNGTGEAIVLLMENPSAYFNQFILEACTHNLAYDPQCEGSRINYLSEIMSFARNKVALTEKIISELNSPCKDYWDTQLLFKLSEVFAKQGNQLARATIYQRYSNNVNEGYEFVDTDVLVSLDGLQGLEFVADIQGKQLEFDADYWVDDMQIQLCKRHFPETNPEKYLQKNRKITVI